MKSLVSMKAVFSIECFAARITLMTVESVDRVAVSPQGFEGRKLFSTDVTLEVVHCLQTKNEGLNFLFVAQSG